MNKDIKELLGFIEEYDEKLDKIYNSEFTTTTQSQNIVKIISLLDRKLSAVVGIIRILTKEEK